MPEAYITKISKFLPNQAVSNDEMEDYLGLLNGKKSKSRAIVLRNNKIKSRYYALDKNGNSTHNNAQMAAQAIEALFQHNKEEMKEMDLLSCATSSPDQLMPSHAVQIHGYLPHSEAIEVVSPSGVCCAGMHAFKYAYMSILLGEKQKAVSCASERLSTILKSEKFEEEIQQLNQLEANPYLAFEKDFLRWMLSDGAGAFLLENKPNPNGLSLKINWIKGFSFAHIEEACMYMGADKLPDGNLKSYKDFTPQEVMENSVLSIKQDVKLLSQQIVSLGFTKLISLLEEKNINASDIDYFLPHLSSYFFEDKIDAELKKYNYDIPKERWFTNLATKGNVGAASIYLMLEELFNEKELKKGQNILLAVPESSRFSYMFCWLTVC